MTLGERIVGGLRLAAGEDATEILELYVRPEMRRTGIAQVALLHAEARCPAARFRAKVISARARPSPCCARWATGPSRTWSAPAIA